MQLHVKNDLDKLGYFLFHHLVTLAVADDDQLPYSGTLHQILMHVTSHEVEQFHIQKLN